ncbi:hypothetical protein AMECASPLE_037443 [Ameca splendens]|uniref:Uncharacterized protein n=1 Tax=Ameca splendens TaxID=208324 RepID=A0ABV0Z5T9_9TELE
MEEETVQGLLVRKSTTQFPSVGLSLKEESFCTMTVLSDFNVLLERWRVYLEINNCHTRTRRLPLHPGPGCEGSRLSKDTQASLSPDTSSSSSRGSPRRSQASRET